MLQTEKNDFILSFYFPNNFSGGGGNSIESIEFAGRRVEEMLHRDSEFPPLATKLKIPGEQQIILNNWSSNPLMNPRTGLREICKVQRKSRILLDASFYLFDWIHQGFFWTLF